jgi:VWFA-related protein
MKFAAAVAVTCALLSGAAVARQGPPPRVNVRVIATDAKGRSVPVTAKDVKVSVGSLAQEILSLTRVTSVPRNIGLLLDEYHVSPGASTDRTRAAIRDFVAREVRPEDAVFVMKPLDAPGAIAKEPSRAHLDEVVAAFNGRKGDYTPRTPFESEYMSVVPPAAARQRAQVSRAAMQALITTLSRQDGPRAVIVFTEGFTQEERGRERFISLRTIAHAARSSDVAVYVVDPSAEPPDRAVLGDTWRTMVAETGGLLIESPAPMETALARISADLNDYYVATIPAPAKEDGAYHEVTVSVNRPGVNVRAPKGFWSRIASERYSLSPRPPMSSYLKTPHASGMIQPSFRMAEAPGGETEVTVSWAPRPRTRGATPASVDLSVVTFEGVRLHNARLLPHGADGTARAVFVATPGTVQVEMAIADAAGKVIDTDVRYIDIPRLDGGVPIITAIELVRARSVPEFQRLQSQPDALPAETLQFDRHDRLLVRIRTAGAANAPIRARLLNRLRRPMKDLAALPDAGGVPQFDLPLAPYASGDYVIEITVGTGANAIVRTVSFRLLT